MAEIKVFKIENVEAAEAICYARNRAVWIRNHIAMEEPFSKGVFELEHYIEDLDKKIVEYTKKTLEG